MNDKSEQELPPQEELFNQLNELMKSELLTLEEKDELAKKVIDILEGRDFIIEE